MRRSSAQCRHAPWSRCARPAVSLRSTPAACGSPSHHRTSSNPTIVGPMPPRAVVSLRETGRANSMPARGVWLAQPPPDLQPTTKRRRRNSKMRRQRAASQRSPSVSSARAWPPPAAREAHPRGRCHVPCWCGRRPERDGGIVPLRALSHVRCSRMRKEGAASRRAGSAPSSRRREQHAAAHAGGRQLEAHPAAAPARLPRRFGAHPAAGTLGRGAAQFPTAAWGRCKRG